MTKTACPSASRQRSGPRWNRSPARWNPIFRQNPLLAILHREVQVLEKPHLEDVRIEAGLLELLFDGLVHAREHKLAPVALAVRVQLRKRGHGGRVAGRDILKVQYEEPH